MSQYSRSQKFTSGGQGPGGAIGGAATQKMSLKPKTSRPRNVLTSNRPRFRASRHPIGFALSGCALWQRKEAALPELPLAAVGAGSTLLLLMHTKAKTNDCAQARKQMMTFKSISTRL